MVDKYREYDERKCQAVHVQLIDGGDIDDAPNSSHYALSTSPVRHVARSLFQFPSLPFIVHVALFSLSSFPLSFLRF